MDKIMKRLLQGAGAAGIIILAGQVAAIVAPELYLPFCGIQ